MRIANNFPALMAFRSLEQTNQSLQKTVNALSTGLRINQSSDDAAGFAISEKMRSQLSGLNTAARNSQDGISLLQTADGALGEVNSMLQRMRELAVQASNDSLTSNDRQYIQLEIDELKDQINRIADSTQFNTKRILNGNSGAMWSSSDPNVKVKINGGLTYIDEFGQKVSAEGNYRIEVSAKGGQAQVQKSNIMTTAREETVTETVITRRAVTTQQPIYEERITWDETELVDDVDVQWKIILNGGDNGEAVNSAVKDAANIDEINSGWTFSGNTLTIKESGTYHITSLGTTTNRIVVATGVEANIFLEDTKIDVSGGIDDCAFRVEGTGTANVFLMGDNTITSGSDRAGLEVAPDASLMICSADGLGSTTGKLTATSAQPSSASGGGAGIGGPGFYANDGTSGSIVINGGTIIASGSLGGAGIGGGNSHGDDKAAIIINGGDVTAYGGVSRASTNIAGGAGIGSGHAPHGVTSIDITGGTVRAYGGGKQTDSQANTRAESGAGIGGGGGLGQGIQNATTTIRISNALRNSIVAVPGDNRSEAIGHGSGREAATVQYMDFPAVNVVVPDLPSATVRTPATIRDPIIEEVLVGYEEVTTYEDVETEVTEQKTTLRNLSEISQFYTPGGASIIAPNKKLTITQGDGKSATIVLYPLDNMEDVARKINDAIANDLGQGRYTDNPNKFCTISDGSEGSSESVYEREAVYDDERNIIGYDIKATMLIRSAIPGQAGELYFSGDEDLLNAFGFNTIQTSKDAEFIASLYDAHTGVTVATNVKSSGAEFKSLIPVEIDVEVDPMAGLSASWDEDTKRFIMTHKDVYSAMIHLKDSGTVFQIGANEGEDFLIHLGDCSCDALGITNVNLLTRQTASRAITVLDKAITKTASQRAKIGAYENALEHTMNNLMTSAANLTNAESRIRDADMSLMMMDFVK
ncbi:MAG: hypothetical protein IJU31_01275, partial [Synergistaceae bacterium]|nr:hypothetical protein [Synergistaceae bacterium]